jgi:dihydroorotate dehydrogenase (NAD+) catalytic subunit
MPADLKISLGALELKNPVIAGAGEVTMDAEGIRAALHAGAGAVVAKSTNESEEARDQLRGAEYLLLDASWEQLPWGPAPREASLFCRSGLQPMAFAQWVELLAQLDRDAAGLGAYVVPSLIVADPDEAARRAKEIEAAALRWLELNVSPPHAGEAPAGAMTAAQGATVESLVEPVRRATGLPLTVKVSGEGDVMAGARAARRAGADAVCLAGRHLGFLPDLRSRRPLLGTFGAIGGAWSLPLTLRWIAKARAELGPRLPLIGTNGARSGADVARFLLAGAGAVEMTSAVITDGVAALTAAIDELTAYLDEQGTSASAIIGEAADHATTYEERTKERLA